MSLKVLNDAVWQHHGSVDRQKRGAGREKRRELTLMSAFVPFSVFLELI